MFKRTLLLLSILCLLLLPLGCGNSANSQGVQSLTVYSFDGLSIVEYYPNITLTGFSSDEGIWFIDPTTGNEIVHRGLPFKLECTGPCPRL